MGDIYVTTNSVNPSTTWLGTTWSKIEGRFLLGTSNSQATKLTGGSMSKTISQANLPNIKLTVDSFSLSRGNMDITGTFAGYTVRVNSNISGAFTSDNATQSGPSSTDNSVEGQNTTTFTASRSWTGTTNSVSPQTNSLGSGQALDITPSYYTTHMWLRTS